MRHISVKVRMTIWFTVVMVVISSLMLVFVMLMNRNQVTKPPAAQVVSVVTRNADRLEVKVLGTQFNLKSYQEDAKSEVSLVRGKVSVGIKASKMNGKLTLAPGDILRFNKTNNHIDFLNFDPDSYANWIDNDNFFFVEQTLGDIVADLRRHFAVEIVVTDKSLCDETYYASFVNEESLDEILDALNKDRLFSVRREAEVYYISPPLK